MQQRENVINFKPLEEAVSLGIATKGQRHFVMQIQLQ
jgi:hypothetical protein